MLSAHHVQGIFLGICSGILIIVDREVKRGYIQSPLPSPHGPLFCDPTYFSHLTATTYHFLTWTPNNGDVSREAAHPQFRACWTLMTLHGALLTLELTVFLPSSCNSYMPSITHMLHIYFWCKSQECLEEKCFGEREWKIQRPQGRSVLSMFQTTRRPIASEIAEQKWATCVLKANNFSIISSGSPCELDTQACTVE